MEEINPLETTPVNLRQKSCQNRRGRPLTAKAVKFTPQPKSIISRLLRRVREKDCDSVHNQSYNSGCSMVNNDYYKVESDPEQANTNKNINESFTVDVSTLENDPIDYDNFKDNCLDYREENYQANTNIIWAKKSESDPKPCQIACYMCSHRSSSHKEHRKHLGTHRNQPYACNFPNCTYTCKLSCNLIKHRRIHTSEKPYLCDQCTFRSNFANSLKVHKRIHTSERPYGCQHCSYRCNSSSNLKKHCQHKHRNMS